MVKTKESNSPSLSTYPLPAANGHPFLCLVLMNENTTWKNPPLSQCLFHIDCQHFTTYMCLRVRPVHEELRQSVFVSPGLQQLYTFRAKKPDAQTMQ